MYFKHWPWNLKDKVMGAAKGQGHIIGPLSNWLASILFHINSSDARDGIFQLIWSIPCLLMPWLFKSPAHQQTWYWQYRIGKMLGCSIVNLVFFCWIRFKIWYEMWMHVLQSLKQFSMLRVNQSSTCPPHWTEWFSLKSINFGTGSLTHWLLGDYNEISHK